MLGAAPVASMRRRNQSALVGQDNGAVSQTLQQLPCDWTISRLARGQQQLKWQILATRRRMDPGRQPAARAAHTAIRMAFFEFAAC